MRDHSDDVCPSLWVWQGSFGFAWANKMSSVKSLGTLMVKRAVQILGLIFPVCIGKVTRGLSDSVLKAHFLCVCEQWWSLFSPQQTQPWLTCSKDYEWKCVTWCSAQLLGRVVKLHSFDVSNSSPLLTSLGSVCSGPKKQPVYLYTKQTALKSPHCSFWSAEKLCHSFARSERLYFLLKPLWNPYLGCLFLFLLCKVICFHPFPQVLSEQSPCKHYWCF